MNGELTVNLLPDDIPGPGTYEPNQTCFGKSRNSSTIYVTDRKLTMEDMSKKYMPGPGMYKLPSDFGYVDFKKNRNLKSVARKSRNNGKNRTMTKSATYSKSHA